jgi:CheY-like chemotaxis protein
MSEPSTDTTTEPRTGTSRDATDPHRPRRILIIDDDAAVTRLLTELFAAEGSQVSTAQDGLQAMQVLSRRIAEGVPPDLILLDLHMAGADGWEFHAQLDRLGISIPIVVITGDPDPQRCAEEVNAVGYLAKPFDLRDLDGFFDQLVLTGTRITQHTRDTQSRRNPPGASVA